MHYSDLINLLSTKTIQKIHEYICILKHVSSNNSPVHNREKLIKQSLFDAFCLQLAVKCMTEEEVMTLYISRAQELERDGKFKEAER